MQHPESISNALKYCVPWLTNILFDATVPAVSFTREETGKELSVALHYTDVREVECVIFKTSTQSQN